MALKEQILNPIRIKGICTFNECGKPAKGILCSTCRARIWRIGHPVQYAYNNIKNRAQQRGIPFDLTIEQFELFCTNTSYIEYKGRCAEGITIDRIDENRGYCLDNIQVMTLVKNIKKHYSKTNK
jgi:hypothetical protein